MLFCEKITTEKKLDPLGSIPKAHLLAFNNKVAKIRSSKEVEAGKTASSTKKRSAAFASHSGPKFSKKSVNYVKVNGICEFENIYWQKNMKEELYISQHNYIFFSYTVSAYIGLCRIAVVTLQILYARRGVSRENKSSS